MKHYYFKFGPKNNFFAYHLSKDDVKEIDLAIFFGTNWSVKMYFDNPSDVETENRKFGNFTQIQNFMECQKTKSYFWIFYDGKVYLYEPLDKSVPRTGEKGFYDNRGIKGDVYKDSTPKFIRFRLIEIFESTRLPESFSTINANQKYNRKTIKEFVGIEKQIASHIVDYGLDNMKMRIPIDGYKTFEYLSPIQFETLIFLIFHHNDCYVSAYRGGTRKDIDLVIRSYGDFDCFKSGNYNIQLKMDDVKNPKMYDVDFLIHLGKTSVEDRVLGMDWIEKQLKQVKVSLWLKESLRFFQVDS